ncbi:MAG: ribosome small subunit-dependent GTPase A [Gammaproteobacteria bacterium]
MAKRKLNTQQTRRLSEKRTVKQEQEIDSSAKQTGKVITNFGKKVLVEVEHGKKIKCSIRQNLGKLVAGDEVVWEQGLEASTGIISQLKERTNLLSRPGFRGEMRMIAANISLIGIVVPVVPGIHPDMIDRYLVASSQLGIPSFIILNKIDLIVEQAHWEAIEEILQPYIDLEIPIVQTSNLKNEQQRLQPRDALHAQLSDHVSVFVGASGAGKSSLINSLMPDLDIRIGELSEATGLGSHTTSNSILYHLPSGGDLIDSPGIRQFTPEPCSLSELEQHFDDFEAFLGKCKFNNCTHTHEPDCEIIQAIDDGHISAQRLQSFHRLLQEFEA